MLTRLTERWRAAMPWRGGHEAAPRAALLRLGASADPAAVYAIGDIHGRFDLLQEIEAQIVADAASIRGEKWMVTLGDAIDRGPDSSRVLAHLMAPAPAGFSRFVLAGNHEQLMLDFIADPRPGSSWLELGGRATLQSYGVSETVLERDGNSARGLKAILDAHVPEDHLAFLQSLPAMLRTPSRVFVHAGLRPGVPIEKQTDEDLLWFRDDFAADYLATGLTVVHGHSITPQPIIRGNRIALDTGAVASGRLSAVRLVAGEAPALFATGHK